MKKAANEQKQAAAAAAAEETVFNTGRWTQTEIGKCAQSLYPNGSSTNYAPMGEHVTTRSNSAITLFGNQKVKHNARILETHANHPIFALCNT